LGGSGVWTQGLLLARQVVYHVSFPTSNFFFFFALVVFQLESCIFPRAQLQIMIIPMPTM
jgi:hypothetical protein